MIDEGRPINPNFSDSAFRPCAICRRCSIAFADSYEPDGNRSGAKGLGEAHMDPTAR